MDASDHSRKLTVILAADVAGYSRMVATDDVATVQTLNSYRDIFRSKITAYHGQVIDTAGDSVLAQFASALEAVQCGLEIQSELKTRNDTLAMNRRMLFRMGINIGDVLQQTDGTIYGDGVNIAARLESLSVPGGVTISGTVYDQVKTRLRSSFTFLGEQHVKNIPEPIRTYAVTEAAESQPGALLDPGKASTTRPRRMSLYVGGGVGVLLLVLFVSAMVALRKESIDAALPRIARIHCPALHGKVNSDHHHYGLRPGAPASDRRGSEPLRRSQARS